MSPQAPQDICRRAAELIRQHGWVQGQIGGTHIGFCLWGALIRASGPDFAVLHEADRLVRRRFSWWARWTNRPPSWWNDKMGRTQAEVLAVLDEASRS